MKRSMGVLAMLLLAGSCGTGGMEGERLARAMNLPMEVRAVCGDSGILGQAIESPGGGACGIDEPVQVHAVGGVRLSPAATLDCTAARALKDWADTGAREAAEAAGTRITGLTVAGSHACRRRNNRPAGKLSEHAKGNAIDIAAISFADGDRATVLDDWSGRPRSDLMQRLHAAACGPFGVVLGPKADRHHRDHFHFDVSNPKRPYCR